MKKISSLIILSVFAFAYNVFAQQKELSLEETVINYKLYGDFIYGLKWQPATQNYTYISYKESAIKISSAKSNKDKTFLTLEDIKKITRNDSINNIPSYEWINSEIMKFRVDSVIYIVNIKTKKLKTKFILSSEAENISYNEKANAIAYTLKNNLYLLLSTGKTIQITNEPDGIVCGQIVSRNEFGIDKGIFWSPQGNYIAFYRKDERKVTDYPVVDVTKRIAKVTEKKYPMAGMTSEIVWLGIYNIKTGNTIYLEQGNSEQYLTSVTWGSHEKYIYIAILNREQNHLWLNKYNVTTGEKIKTLFEEQNKHYVEPENPLFFVPNSNDKFLWLSERSGYNHFYLYNTDGKLIKQVTNGNWVVTKFVGFDKKGENVIFTSTMSSPIENRIYKVSLKTGKIIEISNEPGTHTAILNKGTDLLFDIFSDTITPRTYTIKNTTGKLIKTIKKSNDYTKEYNFPKMKIFTIKADNGSELYCRMILPNDFDKTKKYPVLVYVYGGPHVQLINNSWLGGAQLWLYYMAQEGYIVFTLDNHGSANRGLNFESIIHRQLGQQEMKDQIKGIEYLKSLPYIDTTRIGVYGWSYGGFMTISLMLNYPKIFKTGVAGGPVIDWKYYEVMYGERYMDTPYENPDGYKKTSLLDNEKIQTLKGRKLLIIHGAMDATVVWQHSLLFLKKCIENNVQVDYFVYPTAEHNVRGYDRIHLLQKITDYFNTFLK